MKALLLLSLSLISSAAFANNTHCSDATGHLMYSHQGWNAGIPPRDGDVIDTIEVRIDGKLASKSIAYQGKSADLGPINPDFSEIRVIKEESGSNGYNKDFSAKLALSQNGSKRLPRGLVLPQEAYVICHESFLAIP